MIFNVKDESLSKFFYPNDDDKNNNINISPYHMMQDNILMVKRTEFGVGDNIIFDLVDFTSGSRTKLSSIYIYIVEDFDSVQIRLKLVSHDVTIVKI